VRPRQAEDQKNEHADLDAVADDPVADLRAEQFSGRSVTGVQIATTSLGTVR